MSEAAPRPPRSLRDKKSVPPPSSETENKVVKPDNYGNEANSYMDNVEEVLTEEEEKAETVNNIIEASRPKVQVLNVRQKRISADEARKESKKKIKEDVDKVKEEFDKVEEVVEETREELGKITEKVKSDASLIKARLTAFGLKTVETLLILPKDFILGLIFKKKKVKEAPAAEEPKQSKRKQIPRIKYADLLAKRIEFLAHDKTPLVDPQDTGIILEEIFMANAIADVRHCTRFVVELTAPTKGMYANREIVEIFHNATSEDINYFLYYVNSNPEPFTGTRYKFSEAFATWIIRKSHEL